MEIEADNHLQIAAAYASIAPTLSDAGARTKTLKDLFKSLDLAKYLRGFDLEGIKRVRFEDRAVPQENLYLALKEAGLVGVNAEVAEDEEK